GAAEVRRTVERRDLDRFERRESALDEQLHGALIGVSRNHAATASRVRPDNQRPAGAKEIHLELTRLREERRVRRSRTAVRGTVGVLELITQLREQHVEPGRQWPTGRECLEYGERGCDRDMSLDHNFCPRLQS